MVSLVPNETHMPTPAIAVDMMRMVRVDVRVARAMRGGILVAMAAAFVFLAAHALLIQPIWLKAAPRALGLAVFGGALVGYTYQKIEKRLPGTPMRRGALYGGMLAAVFLPSIVAGDLAAAGESLLARIGVLLIGHMFVFLLYGHVFAAIHHGAFQREAWARTYVTAWVVNGFPAFFLFFLDRFVIDRAPGNPYPMSAVLFGIYVVSGAAFAAWHARRVPARVPGAGASVGDLTGSVRE